MKILFIAPKYEGGIGGHAFRVADKLRSTGHEVKIMHARYIPIKKLKNPSFALISSIQAKLDFEKYDIVHAFNLPSAFAMKQVNAKKRVLSIHGIYSEQVDLLHSDITSKAASITESKVLKWADVLTTDSMLVKNRYKEKLGVEFKLMYAPINVEKFKEINHVNKKLKQVVYIGRDSYEKGIDILRKIESQVNAKVVYCTNLDWITTMEKLQESLILIVPSRMESIPQVIKEAFFLKVPVIAFNVGGISEIVKDGINGKLIEPENEKDLLLQINKMLNDVTSIQQLGQNGFNYIIENFTWEKLLPKYLKFYNNLLEN